MLKSDDELEKTVEPTSLDPTVISRWHLLEIVGAIAFIYFIFHFLEKHW
jgi:hypothetical protein